MLLPGATDYHVSRRAEIDQPHAVARSCRVEAKLSDNGTKYTFLTDLRCPIPWTLNLGCAKSLALATDNNSNEI